MTPTPNARRLLALLLPVLLAACARLGPASVPVAPQAAPGYAAQDLGTLGGSSYAYGTSADGGVVVGSSVTEGGSARAFIWTPGAGMRDLGTLGGETSYAAAVSADGRTVVGTSYRGDDGPPHAFIWTEAAGMQDLGTLGGPYSTAADVSADGGTVVGSSSLASGETHAFVWTRAGGMKDLGTLGGGSSYAYGVSPDGRTVVGTSRASDQLAEPHLYRESAFRWTQVAGMQNLGTLGGNSATAYDARNDGEVVGYSRNALNNGSQAFRWTPDLGMRSLSAPGGDASFAYGVSERGEVVGTSDFGEHPNRRAFVWTPAVGMAALGTLGGPYAAAQGVSASGDVIVGYSYAAGGDRPRATRWVRAGTPTPTTPDRYTADFEAAPTGTVIYRVGLGRGLVHLGGGTPTSSSVPVVGKRRSGSRILQAQTARVVPLWGSKRLAVVMPGTNTPAPQGGRLKLSFDALSSRGVTLTSLTLSNLTTRGAYLTFYTVDGRSSRRALETTSAGGSLTVALNVPGLRAVDVFAPGAYALDDVRFTSGG